MKTIFIFAIVLVAAFQGVVATTPAPENTNCDLCEYVVGIIENYVAANYTDQQIITFLDGWCDVVPQLAQVCDQIVQWGVQDVINFVKNNENPDQVCTQLKLCTSNQIEQVKIEIVEVSQSTTCDLCETAINFIESYVENNATEQQIQRALDTVCGFIPNLQATCDQIVQYGLTEIINFIKQDYTPEQICTKIGLCTSAAVDAPKPQDTNCDLCTYVVGLVENWLESNDTISTVVARLETFCSFVPGFEQVCDQIVEYGVHEFVAYIENNEQPTTVCTQLGLCKSKKSCQKSMTSLAVAAPADLQCGLCETVIDAIESWLENNKTMTEIKTDLDEYVCALVPAFRSVCDAIFAQGLPDVVQWIEANEDGEVVCTQLSIC